MTRVLFVCSQNLLRSPTAEHVFAALPDVETMSAGTQATAPTPVTAELLEWADVVVAMESGHREWLRERFADVLADQPVFVLGIPDRYAYMDPGLIELLKARVRESVPIPGADAPS